MFTSQQRMLRELQEDLVDMGMLVRGLFSVLARTNPIAVSVCRFAAILDPIDAATPESTRAELVGQALSEVDLSDAPARYASTMACITAVAKDYVLNGYKPLLAMPCRLIGTLAQHRLVTGAATQATYVIRELQKVTEPSQAGIRAIQRMYGQLREHFPRYHSIMTDIGFGSAIVRGMARILGGGLGQAAQIWQNWQAQDDTEFVESYSAATGAFGASAIQFTQVFEHTVDLVISQYLAECSAFERDLVAALARIPTPT